MQRETTKEELEETFAQYGAIEECNFVNDSSRGPRGFGFVTYRETSSTEKALIVRQVFNGRVVDCKRAQSKEDHEMTMHSQYNGGNRGPNGMHGGGPGGPGGPMNQGMGPGAGGPMPRQAQGGGGGYGSYTPDGKYQASMSQGGFGQGAPNGGYGGGPGGAGGGPGGAGGGYDPYAGGYGGGYGGGGYGGYEGQGYPPADAWQGTLNTSCLTATVLSLKA